MDSLLVHCVMSYTTDTDIPVVEGVVQEYVAVDHLAEREKGHGSAWQNVKAQIEQCLRLYLGGNPIATAMRLSGYAPDQTTCMGANSARR